jgi:predicted metal-dependent hydrolase
MSSQIPYTIEISRRARHVQLKLSQNEGLVVVIPVGFDQRRIPRIIAEKADWIKRTQKRLGRQVRPVTPELAQSRPEYIAIASTGETWRVEYISSKSRAITLTLPGNQIIRLTGAISNLALCQSAMRRWTNQYAKKVLPPVLTKLAQEHGFEINAVSIRNQRTRWGSCSRHKAISLNQKLVFLTPDLVRYVMLHELCHTLVLSHSKKFWELVGRVDPEYKMKIRELRKSAKYLPVWA